MRVVYAYTAPRDEALEREIASDLGSRFGGSRQTDAIEASGGIVTVTLELDAVEHPADSVAERIRVRPRVIDAATDSLGEGV
ncbi:hypothetical protein [Arenibaculum pallidiluteum]|uniref:hypothetical protein n=1 Tax=Arenibaculum pallidiluteum TaxID=2812559 RepID=UPI001A96D447|nr:hypothetical protein [Arenibaculum pallidiluteum]